MFLEQQLVDGEFDDRLLVIERLVLLFIDNLQLRLKEAKDRMLEPLRLDDGPLFQAVLRQVHLVDRLFVPRVGVEALFAHRLVELVHLVRDFVLRGQLRFLVDLRVDGLAFLRVGLVKMLFVQLGDAVEVRFFLFVIERANLRRALEQHVLEVMRQARAKVTYQQDRQIKHDASWTHGKHTIQFGASTTSLIFRSQPTLQSR